MEHKELVFSNPYLSTPSQTRREFLSYGLNFLAAAATTGAAVGLKKILNPSVPEVLAMVKPTEPIVTKVGPIEDMEDTQPEVNPVAASPTPPTEAKKPDVLKDCVAKAVGKASYYTESGCMNCNSAQIMKNGKRFDQNALTIAYNHASMNTQVLVKNLDNGKATRAVVTDTGGFEKYGRIADVSKKVKDIIDLKTDQSTIEIDILNKC